MRLVLQVQTHCGGVRLEVDVDAIRAAQCLVVEEQEVDHLGECHRHHDEIDAVGTDHEEADHQGRQARSGGRQGQAPPQRNRVVRWREEGQRVACQPEVGGVAQRHQSGDALQQVQTHGEDGQDHHLREHLQVEVTPFHGDERKGGERQGSQGQQDLDAARQFFKGGFGGAHRMRSVFTV